MHVPHIRRRFIKPICIIGFIACVIVVIHNHKSLANMSRLTKLFGGKIPIWAGCGSSRLAIIGRRGREKPTGEENESNIQQALKYFGIHLIFHFVNSSAEQSMRVNVFISKPNNTVRNRNKNYNSSTIK
jgi:hypothetical protein